MLAALLALASGCASRPAPPAVAAHPVGERVVYVARHNGHTGLIVRAADVPRDAWPARRDLPDAEYLELGWGEREYYIREDEGPWLALRALFWSQASAIHVFAFKGSPAAAFPQARLVELHLSAAGFDRLVGFVAASHERDSAGRTRVLAPGQQPGSLFYASHRRFHVLETCNTWIARALREAGLPVEPARAPTAPALMRQLQGLAVR